MNPEPIYLSDYLDQIKSQRDALEPLGVQSPTLNAAIAELEVYQVANSGEFESSGVNAEQLYQWADEYEKSEQGRDRA